jgi:PHD/YefM family antitoxin component YafN of YafNO toxin-antitoxin module
MISSGRAEPVAVAKRGRPVVVVMAVEEFERLKALDAPAEAPAAERRAKE